MPRGLADRPAFRPAATAILGGVLLVSLLSGFHDRLASRVDAVDPGLRPVADGG